MTPPCTHWNRVIFAVLPQPLRPGQREPDEHVAWLCRACGYRGLSRSWRRFDAELRALSPGSRVSEETTWARG